MTQSFGINSNNDIYLLPSGNLAILAGEAAVEAASSNVSQARLGEEVLTINNGIPFFQAVFNGTPNIAIFQNSLRNALLSVNGVVAVQNLLTNVANNVLSYSVDIVNQFGNVVKLAGEFPLQ